MTDALDRESRRQFVVSQLSMLPGKKKVISGSTFVCCPFHSEKTPSARIFHSPSTRVPGILKCYGCGTVAKWDEFAQQLGLQPFVTGRPVVTFYVPRPVESEVENEKYTLRDLPLGKKWRGISTRLLAEIGCKYYINQYQQKFIWLPVFVNKELRGYTKARLKKEEGKLSYINSKSSWSSEYGLFPFDYSVNMTKNKRVVLVEGQRDALRLISFGIPALAIIGTQSWTDKKARLLEMFGISSVVLLLDGDPAGIQGTQTALEYLEDIYEVRTVALWKYPGNPYPKWKKLPEDERKARKSELWDPGNVPEKVIYQIRRKYFDETS